MALVRLLFGLMLLLLAVRPVAAAEAFLETSGGDIRYNGTSIFLRGTNFGNIQALKARKGPQGDWVWSSSVTINDVTITEADYQKLAELGGNHVRFGMSFSWWRENKTRFYEVMNQHIAWAKKHRLWLVLNLFTTPGDCYEGYSEHCGLWTSSAEQQQLQAFWRDVASTYSNEPTIAGYDLLNEPTPPGPGWSTTWYNLAQQLIGTIRNVDQRHLIFVMSTSDPTFDRLFTGGNIVYEVHDYAPMDMSHCTWSNNTPTYPGDALNWDGRTYRYSKETFGPNGPAEVSLLHTIGIKWSRDNRVPLYVGEWGPSGPCLNGYVQYIQDRADLYKVYGVHHAHYTWRGGDRHWGIYPDSGALTPYNQARLNAVVSSWDGNSRPGGGGAGTPTVTPTRTPTVTPTRTPTPTVTRTPTPTRRLTGTTTPTATPDPTRYPSLTPTPTSTPYQGVFQPPSWWNLLPAKLRNFLELLYIWTVYFNRPSDMQHLLEGIAPTPTP